MYTNVCKEYFQNFIVIKTSAILDDRVRLYFEISVDANETWLGKLNAEEKKVMQ